MKLQAKCPTCSHILHLDISDADKRKRCHRCGRLFKVPDSDMMQDAIKVLETARTKVFVDEQGNIYA